MSLVFCIILIVVNVIAILAMYGLWRLQSIGQIEAELELEMHEKAHQLLVRRDQLEVGLLKDEQQLMEQQWQGDLADYMEEFEQEALQRAKRRLNKA